MKKKSTKWSIQITTDIRDLLHRVCKEQGYKLSGFVEGAIFQRISGSYYGK